ncbi:sugar kinase [Streptomyces sp. NPDC001985]|uniref:carbohydrate kinase family protein n=1 Tax=Streptomyces sp. NPDC001985 TaxID=3154406 RepID=UPI0033199719
MAGRAGGAPALLVIGDVVTDILARHPEPLAPGTDTPARIRILPGGAGANVACWAAHWGLSDVRLLGRVGREDAGWHEERLRSAGVRPRLIPDDTAPTTTVIVLVDANAEPTFLTDSGTVLRFSPADWSPALLEGVGHLHLSGYLFFSGTGRQLARLAVRSARSLGIPVSVDPASTGFIEALGADRLLSAYDGVDVLLPNAGEARSLTGLSDPAAAVTALSRRFPLAVVTLGAEGALVADSGGLSARVLAPTALAVDTTGAGDAFTGAFLTARLRGADAPAAAAEGCRAGAESVRVIGGRPDGPAAPPSGGLPRQDLQDLTDRPVQ